MKNLARENFIYELKQSLESINNQLKGNKFLTKGDVLHLKEEAKNIEISLKKYKI